MTASQARDGSNDVNAKQCKAVLMMIEESSAQGNYELYLDKDLLPNNKRTYLQHLGYNVYEAYNDDRRLYRISW